MALTNVGSINLAGDTYAYSNGTARNYTIRAAANGVVDLRRFGVVNGPGYDDRLQFVITTGGQIDLSSLQQISGNVRVDVRVPSLTLPLLERATGYEFLVSSNVFVTLRVPRPSRAGASPWGRGARCWPRIF